MDTCANAKIEETRVRGQTLYVPSAEICGRTVIVTGKWIRTAEIKDEGVVEGVTVEDPDSFITKLKESNLTADLFTFAQRPPEITPKYDYHRDWDNWATIPTACFEDWWESLPQVSRKNVRRAGRRGVVVKVIPFDDDLVKGVHRIYNGIQIRDGRVFWHYGQDVDSVRRSLATYLDRSEFIGAYLGEELIGFLKMVYVDDTATIFHIISMDEHYDKRPQNALIAKAAEVCEQKAISHLIYGKFIYGNKRRSSLVEFKRRNGFQQVNFPRYYIPLTPRGELFVRLRLYRGVSGLLPEPILYLALSWRDWYYKKISTNLTLKSNKFAGVA
ncbi:MAG TPA: hypothetical protein VFH87_12680 [Candidatus Udaeobacter sp.]|jgi:hypothetical protein|nr:hypothetical protein [Candidatus Udaeobacter sp.]